MGTEPALPRVFVGPIEIAGYYSGLAEALRQAGLDAVSVDLSDHLFRYAQVGRRPWPVRAVTGTRQRLEASRPRGWRQRAWLLVDLVARAFLLAWAVVRFDVFIFGFGETLLHRRDLPLLRLAGKRLIFVFNGSDARPTYVDGAEMADSLGRTADDAIHLARRKKARLRQIERYADVIVSQPAFSHFFERPVVDFFRIGVPLAGHGDRAADGRDDLPIRILHSPSNPEVKGSVQIRAVVDALRAAGQPLELVELRGVPNETVRAEIREADFVIDQIYSDAPMVGFATEAAIAGRPAIVGGYAWPDLGAIYPGAAMPPVEACHPDDLAEAVLRLATDAAYRAALGERARAFVATAWAPEAIAARYLSLIRGEVRVEWLFDPRTLRYVRGVGLTEERAREILRAVIARGGREALQLADKPELEQAFVDFAAAR
jgi:glycosyltransferase involved in cell wall biosynthesis